MRIFLSSSDLLPQRHLDFVAHAVQDGRKPSVDPAWSWVLVFEKTHLGGVKTGAGVWTAVGEEVLVQVWALLAGEFDGPEPDADSFDAVRRHCHSQNCQENYLILSTSRRRLCGSSDCLMENLPES